MFERVNRQEVLESKILALDGERLITYGCEHYWISRGQLLLSKRATENLPGDIAIYLIHRFCCKTLPSVGKEFGITNYSTLSSVVQRVKVRYQRDKYLLKEIDIIKKKIANGQKRTCPSSVSISRNGNISSVASLPGTMPLLGGMKYRVLFTKLPYLNMTF